FFQAEDGIRDFHVTGVQTCALPISRIDAALLQSMLPLYIYKTSSTDRTATTTLAADPDLQVELEAGAVYCIEMYIYFGGEHNDRSEERRVGKEWRSRWWPDE